MEREKALDHKHRAAVFPLEKDCILDGNTFIAKLKALEKCSVCGQHMPDLAFEVGGRTYVFTCQTILENGQVVERTDFPQFMKFLEELKLEGSSIFQPEKETLESKQEK